MKFVNQSVEPLMLDWGLQDVYDSICYAASTCYKSEPKDGEEAERFVDKLIFNGHTAMLEFGTVYLDIPFNRTLDKIEQYGFYSRNPYSKVVVAASNPEYSKGSIYVTTNYRVICENHRGNDLRYMVPPNKNHHKRYGFKIVTSIGVARELTRHRVFSFAQESTRYCNYSRDKFSNEITFILPTWYDKFGDKVNEEGKRQNGTTDMFSKSDFVDFCKNVESIYKAAILAGAEAQEAREVLPLCTKTEICMCGFEKDWYHFFDLRLHGITGKPHPEMLELAKLMYNEFINFLKQ